MDLNVSSVARGYFRKMRFLEDSGFTVFAGRSSPPFKALKVKDETQN